MNVEPSKRLLTHQGSVKIREDEVKFIVPFIIWIYQEKPHAVLFILRNEVVKYSEIYLIFFSL